MNNILTLILILLFSACNNKTEKLFLIDKNIKHESDFLNMVESTNISPIPADSVREYLNWNEIESTRIMDSKIYMNDTNLPTPVVFKDCGKIYKDDIFMAHVLLRIGNDSLGRDYKFFIRTYSLNWEIIDDFDLAIWNKHEERFCYGSINKKLIIERNCDKSESSDIMQITKDGKIIMTSYHKP